MGRGDIEVKDLKLKQVYPSSGDSIILIHGKVAHPYKTWTKQKPEKAVQSGSSSALKKEYLDWTTHEDWLPAAIPGSRIFRFGYRGDWYGKDAIKTRTSDISTSLLHQIAVARRTCAGRPLLFVAHSYGGLVLAKALADAWHAQTRWPDIYAATVVAVFMGTPSRGTTHLLHLSILPQIESTSEYVLRDNIESSKADSEWLQDMFSDFCKSIRESAEDDGKAPSIACYYEREPTDLSFYLRNSKIAEREIPTSTDQYRDIVVSESSACLDNMSSTLDIRKYSRACDHLNLHRFTDLEDEEWITFKEVLQDFAENQPRLSKSYRENLVASLKYKNMDRRRTSISEPCAWTCSWIYVWSPNDRSHGHSFDKWLRGNDPIYWISGRAGSGKSVLLAHIVDDEKTMACLRAWSGQIYLQLLSFFFWKPETGLENSVQGLLQSFLYQLCSFQPAVVMFEAVKELHLTCGQVPSWSVSRLTRVIHAVSKATETTRRYCLFIDGLDEFTGDQDKLLEFVLSLQVHEHVKCCVSSRPERTFEDNLRDVPRLKLEELNYIAIFVFVKLTLRKTRTKDEEKLVHEVCSRAEGVFLWATLVTMDVVRGIKACDEYDMLVGRIRKLPLDLSKIYRRMLEAVDSEHESFLAFYVSCLRAPAVRSSFLTSVSVLAVDRLKSIPSSFEEFVAQCELTTTQIKTHTGGLIESGGLQKKFISVETGLERQQSEWIAKQHVDSDTALATPRQLAQPIHHISALFMEAKELRWVHRSAYDFIFDSCAPQELHLPDLPEVYARLWQAALMYT
ncbi:hypothetical protein CBER1_11379 [Cercospora berteroae]|uniref:Nephrocystin 3-like N-terminal domain-containing protein n=1 Tax=Cercospora berteroae TaxID=357750 RepID=A0A2S6CJN1_9PEZI|nr:hypothetical protein CBER1_11379 [Cercospora berteroae]